MKNTVSRYKKDFIAYCLDLQKVTGEYVNLEWLQNQNELSFSEILDAAFVRNPQWIALIKKVDCCVIAHDHYECNPIHAHVGTYLINRYQLTCDVFDVIGGQTMPASLSAKHLIDIYFELDRISSAVILEFLSREINSNGITLQLLRY